jgi:hypothetical protein
MKIQQNNTLKAVVVLTLSLLFIASSSVAITATQPEKTLFSLTKTTKILGSSGRAEEEI